MSRNFGYLRVSTDQQKLNRQVETLKQFVDKKYIYSDKASGKDMGREGF